MNSVLQKAVPFIRAHHNLDSNLQPQNYKTVAQITQINWNLDHLQIINFGNQTIQDSWHSQLALKHKSNYISTLQKRTEVEDVVEAESSYNGNSAHSHCGQVASQSKRQMRQTATVTHT